MTALRNAIAKLEISTSEIDCHSGVALSTDANSKLLPCHTLNTKYESCWLIMLRTQLLSALNEWLKLNNRKN